MLTRRYFLALSASMAAVRQARALSFVVTPATTTFGTTFFVSPTGSDSNPGTSPAQAWQTIAHVNSQTFHRGDQILFQGGATFAGSLSISPTNYVSQPAFVSGNPLVIGSFGTGNATITPTSADGVAITNVSNVVVQNLTLTGDNSQNFNGVNLAQDGTVGPIAGFKFANLTISNFGRAGIIGTAADVANSVSGVSVLNCSVSNCTGNINITGQVTAGIVFGTAQALGTRTQNGETFTTTLAFVNTRVDTCTVENCPGTASPGSNAQCSTGVLFYNSANGLIQFCFISGNGANETQGNAGIEVNWNTNTVAQFNEVFNQISVNAPSDGDAIDLDAGCINCTVQYNYCHHCGGAGISLLNFSPFSHTGNVVRFNILENNMQSHTLLGELAFLSFSGGSMPTGFQVYNNTVFNNINSGTVNLVSFFNDGGQAGSTSTGVFANNIIVKGNASNTLGIEFVAITLPGFSVNGNFYFSAGATSWNFNGTSFTTLAAYKTGSGQEANSSVANPLLTSPGSGGTIGGYNPPNPTAYDLQTGSPAIGVGLNLATAFSINPGTQDFYGNAIPNGTGTGFNAGAFGGTGGTPSCDHSLDFSQSCNSSLLSAVLR